MKKKVKQKAVVSLPKKKNKPLKPLGKVAKSAVSIVKPSNKVAKSAVSIVKPSNKVAKSAVSSVIMRELIETANANDAKIKHEDFMNFLSENNLLEHKKEIVAHLGSLNIKILRKMTVLNQEKLAEYNSFLTDFRKELKAILKKVKKGFGIIEIAAINYIFGSEEAFKKNQKFIKHFLKENEIKPIKRAAKKVTKAGQRKI